MNENTNDNDNEQTLHFAGLVRVALTCFLAAVVSAPVQAELTEVASVEGITEYSMDNGLRILLFPDQSQPTITVNITYLVGSRHEGYGETGMAHLLEHLVFKGTPGHPDIPQELTERGAQPNGSTWFDRTNYYETFPATEDNLAWALDLEADRMINSYISAEDLASEMTVVRNEMESGENNPYRMLRERTLSTAYLWHNYGKATIGARSDVENVPIERLQAFYRKYYQPDNAVLVVAGKFDVDRAKDLLEEKFGVIPRPDRTGGNQLYPTYTREPVQDGERSITLRRVGDVQLVMASYHVPAGTHEDFVAVDILSHVLGNAPSGRLHKKLVESGAAASVSASLLPLKEPGPLMMFAEVPKAGSLDDAWQLMSEAIENVRDAEPVLDEEVERARTYWLKQMESTFNSSRRTALNLSEWAAMGDWRLFFLYRDRLAQVKTADVQRVARSYLKPQNRTLGYFIPTDEPDRAEVPPPPDVAAMVAGYKGRAVVEAGEAFDPTPENIEARTTRVTLPNGFKLAMLPKTTRGGIVNISFRILFGSEQSLTNKSTAGSVAGSMLMRGTKNRTRQELVDEFNRLKAQGGVGGGSGSASGSFQTTRENLAAVLRLAGEVLKEPAFEPDQFDELKRAALSGIEAQGSDPRALSQIAMGRHLTPQPKGHPNYVATLEEQLAEMSAATLDDATEFYENFYGASDGHMAIVGAFDPKEIEPLITEIFGNWNAEEPFTRVASHYQAIAAEKIVIETPDKPNAMFMAGLNLNITDEHPDYPALMLGNFMLGGGFLSSRLATRVRQQDGLSYSVGSGVFAHPIDQFGQFNTYAIYAPENAEALERAIREELVKVTKDGFSKSEVAEAIAGYIQSRETRRANDRALAGLLSQGLYLNRTMAWQAEFEDKIRALTPKAIRAAVRRHIDPDKMSVVIAGDFTKPKDLEVE